MYRKLFRQFTTVSIVICVSIIFCFIGINIVLAQENSSNSFSEYLDSVMDLVRENYWDDTSDRQLVEGALKGIFNGLDDYSVFYTPDEAGEVFSDIQGEYFGIGVVISKVGEYVIITKVLTPSPAAAAGIITGDRIVAVDGQNINGIPLHKISALIKGDAETKVVLNIMRNGQQGIMKIEAVRGPVKVNPISYEIINEIGYIKIDVFNSNTDEFLRPVMEDMENKQIKKIILDLRDNPGGEVDEVVAVGKYFVPKGLITRLDFKSEETEDKEYYSDQEKVKYKLIVLVNGMSASASEILAGAIQDTGAGVLVGTKTYGKSRVQNIIPLLSPEAFEKYKRRLKVEVIDGFELISRYNVMPSEEEIIGWVKLTTGEYYTPDGRAIDGIGLTPDIVVEDLVPLNGISVYSVSPLAQKTKPSLDTEGFDVFNAEQILQMLNYDIEGPDMKFDEKTFRAVSTFQKDKGLYSYGVLDFTTQNALNRELERLILETDKQYAKALELLEN
ncbi:S41 family peptidase [Phosphitispora sp. TUW77]|uniref:S41 family peptidase n=1 Tax=Phosphitispora sp. TUW77 TaxID=3152361 RepID=UPI003AB51115